MNELDKSLENFHKQLLEKITSVSYQEAVPEIEQIVRTSIDRNFSEGGRFGDGLFGGGHNKWEPSKRAIKQHGQTLLDKGILASSIQVSIEQQGVELIINAGSNLPYAAIHNFGGKIHIPARSRLYVQQRYSRGPKKGQFKKGTKFGQGYTTKSYTIKMPQRPYLVLQDADIVNILNAIARCILK